MQMDSPLFVAIAMGDFTGIGPEITLKALAIESKEDLTRYLLIGDPGGTRDLNERLGSGLSLSSYETTDHSDRFRLWNPLGQELGRPLPAGSPDAARAAVAWVREGAQKCLRGELDALVTAPVNKEAIVRSGL